MITCHDVDELIESNKEVINKLPPQQQKNLWTLDGKIRSKINRYESIEKNVENDDKLSIQEINNTYTTLRDIESQSNETFMKMKGIIGTNRVDINKDVTLRTASFISRQGVVNIRPIQQGTYINTSPNIPTVNSIHQSS
jgi:hypothetical protein